MGKSFFENKKSTTLTITFWNYAMFQYKFAPPELKWNLVSGRKLFIGIGTRVAEQFNAQELRRERNIRKNLEFRWRYKLDSAQSVSPPENKLGEKTQKQVVLSNFA